MPEWYRLSGSQAIETLKTDPSSGLTSSEVVARRERFGW
ncbi:MAG TPA: hypothetical protein DDW93_01480, partial [Firmicutes bacterium]|nr:hypothetical protein [Bacillota bacterium]